eukprot:m.10660 g.10660  ORF g.10660 m.10660 type:complete len:53 (-) comp4345_c0_seq1:378-536(-)
MQAQVSRWGPHTSPGVRPTRYCGQPNRTELQCNQSEAESTVQDIVKTLSLQN